MNAALRHDPLPQGEYAMKGAVLVSVLFHLTLFLITAVGLPFISTPDLIESTPINVEIIDIDKISQTNKFAPPKKKAEEPKPPPPKEEKPTPKEMSAETPPDLLSPKPPEAKKEKDPTPPEPEEVVPEPVKKKDEPKPKPPPKPKKPEAKPKPPEPKQEDKFSSLLKNLTPDLKDISEEDAPDSTADGAAPLSQLAQLSDRLTISELDAFKQQIAPCWNVPAGSKYAEDLRVDVRVLMNRDMTVQSASVIDQGRYNRDTHFRAAADSALRALVNPRCQPLKLPADKYDQWKTILVGFDPREML